MPAPKNREAYEGVARYFADHRGEWRSTAQVASGLLATGAIATEYAVRLYVAQNDPTGKSLSRQALVGATRYMSSVLKWMHEQGKLEKRPVGRTCEWRATEAMFDARPGLRA